MFLNIASFLPLHIKENHPFIESTELGVILAMYQVARLLLSTTIGGTMQKVGRKNYIMIGFVLLIISTVGFALIGYVDTEYGWLFFASAIVLRFVQGIGGTCLQVSSYSIILSEFATKREVGLAYLSAARGLGFLGGPLSGQLFYTAVGYVWTFVIFSIIMGVTLVFSYFALPVSLNANLNKTKAA